jgi:hypothetical protein
MGRGTRVDRVVRRLTRSAVACHKRSRLVTYDCRCPNNPSRNDARTSVDVTNKLKDWSYQDFNMPKDYSVLKYIVEFADIDVLMVK